VASPLHVVHVVLSLEVGGLEQVVLHLTRAAEDLQQRVSILCIERLGALQKAAEELGAKLYCINKQPGLRFDTVQKVKAILATLKPDVVHTHQIGALFYTGPAARSLQIPVIVHTEHGKQINTWKQKLLGWWAARYANRLYAVSADIKTALAQAIAPASKIDVVPNGIDVKALQQPSDLESLRAQWQIPINAPVIGTVARLAPVKRQDLLLELFRVVRTQVPDCHLILVGDGEERTRLESLAQEMGISDDVRFVGMQDKPADFLHLMSAFVLTSESEGMPLSLLEAWAVGLPVFVFAVGGLPELVKEGNTGYLATFGEVTVLAEKVIKHLKKPAVAKLLVERGRDKVLREFDIRSMAATYDQHYRALLARSAT
jgi:glycosyltransferase involved in cell wall biosynthesis